MPRLYEVWPGPQWSQEPQPPCRTGSHDAKRTVGRAKNRRRTRSSSTPTSSTPNLRWRRRLNLQIRSAS